MLKRDYILGALTGFAFGCIMIVVNFLNISSPNKGVEPPRFGVIDEYKGCDVVRYEPKNRADYVFFLDCRKENDN